MIAGRNLLEFWKLQGFLLVSQPRFKPREDTSPALPCPAAAGSAIDFTTASPRPAPASPGRYDPETQSAPRETPEVLAPTPLLAVPSGFSPEKTARVLAIRALAEGLSNLRLQVKHLNVQFQMLCDAEVNSASTAGHDALGIERAVGQCWNCDAQHAGQPGWTCAACYAAVAGPHRPAGP